MLASNCNYCAFYGTPHVVEQRVICPQCGFEVAQAGHQVLLVGLFLPERVAATIGSTRIIVNGERAIVNDE